VAIVGADFGIRHVTIAGTCTAVAAYWVKAGTHGGVPLKTRVDGTDTVHCP